VYGPIKILAYSCCFWSQEVIFVSKQAVFKPPKAVRGGIPVCWPQFNDMGPSTSHGFARNSLFEVENQSRDEVTLLLKSNENSRATFPFDRELRVKVLVTDDNGGSLIQTVRQTYLLCRQRVSPCESRLHRRGSLRFHRPFRRALYATVFCSP
jgi:D-hexose-6-phosphate mutarotase